MKKIILFAFAAIIAVSSFAQTGEEVVLVTNGQGSTKREATENALRSAIEQAFGVFVSANTEILNDELVKDEIATVASGNIHSYKEISSEKLADGTYEVALKAVVSINKLVKYAQSHGSTCELAGQKFLMEQKMIELKQENTTKTVEHFLTYLEHFIQNNNIWECNLQLQTPMVVEGSDDMFKIPAQMEFKVNPTIVNEITCKAITLFRSIEISDKEKQNLEDRNMLVSRVVINVDLNNANLSVLGKNFLSDNNLEAVGNEYYCRGERYHGSTSSIICAFNTYNLDAAKILAKANKIKKILNSQLWVLYDNNNQVYFPGSTAEKPTIPSMHSNPCAMHPTTGGITLKSNYSRRSFVGSEKPSECLLTAVSSKEEMNKDKYKRNNSAVNLISQGIDVLIKLRFSQFIKFTAGSYPKSYIFVSRERLSKIADFKLDIYNFSPMKAIYGESYDVACEKMDLSLLKNIQIFEMHKLNPTEESAVGCAKTCMKTGDYEDAIKYFTQAIELAPEEDKEDRAGYLFNIAYIYFDKFKSYEQSRQYLRRSLEQKDGQGRCYLLMGMLYAASKPYGEETTYEAAILNKTVFWVAVDKFLKAKEVDPIVADDANKLIARYSKYFPTTEEISALSELQEGASFMVGGWIQETTTCRAAK